MIGWILFVVFYVLCGEVLSLLIKSSAHLPDEKIVALTDHLKYEPRWMFWLFGGVGTIIAFTLMAVERAR